MTQDLHAAPDTGAYEIGAVCHMTGLSQHVLRVWEKRYGAVQPSRRSNRRRLYSREDVEKLVLLKALVDRGHGIGSIADLSIDELKSRLEISDDAAASQRSQSVPSVLFVGHGVSPGQEISSPGEHFEVVAHYARLELALAATDRPRTDLAVVEWPSLFEQSAARVNRVLRQLNTGRLLLIYDYASTPALEALNPDRISAVRGPIGLGELDAIIRALPGAARSDVGDDAPPPARRYDDATLARIAALPNAIKCECPRHLAYLVLTLGRFEDYSADCQSLNREDAELHRFLHRAAGQARDRMEAALAKVIEAESFDEVLHDGQEPVDV